MNVRMMSFCLLSLLAVFGCSPSGDNKNTRQSPESMDVDRGFHELETNFWEGTLNPITCGRELLKKIERIPWPDERRHCLELEPIGNATFILEYSKNCIFWWRTRTAVFPLTKDLSSVLRFWNGSGGRLSIPCRGRRGTGIHRGSSLRRTCFSRT